MGCDLCGKEGPLTHVRTEGSTLTVCDGCKTFGEEIKTSRAVERAAEKREWRAARHGPHAAETLLLVVQDYGARIKRARETRGLKQEELAQRLRIKESQLHTYEAGLHTPDLDTARTMEKALGITLVEQHVEEKQASGATNSGPMTIADLIKKR